MGVGQVEEINTTSALFKPGSNQASLIPGPITGTRITYGAGGSYLHIPGTYFVTQASWLPRPTLTPTHTTNLTTAVVAKSYSQRQDTVLLRRIRRGTLRRGARSYSLPTYQSLGVSRGVWLHYDSSRADSQIVHFGYNEVLSDPNLRLVAKLTVHAEEVDLQAPVRRTAALAYSAARMSGQFPTFHQIPSSRTRPSATCGLHCRWTRTACRLAFTPTHWQPGCKQRMVSYREPTSRRRGSLCTSTPRQPLWQRLGPRWPRTTDRQWR